MDVKEKFNKQYLDDPRISSLNLSEYEIKQWYPQIVKCVEDKKFTLIRDTEGRIRFYYEVNDTNWLYKSYPEKYKTHKLDKDTFPDEETKESKVALAIELSKLKKPINAYFYSSDPRDIDIVIAYANTWAVSKKVSFLSLESVNKRMRENQNVQDVFQLATISDICILEGLRPFPNEELFTEHIIPLLKARITNSKVVVFFSEYKICELTRLLQKKFPYSDSWKKLEDYINILVNGYERKV